MATYSLTFRITDYLKRQIQWSEVVLKELESFKQAEDSDFEVLLLQQHTREREAHDMSREYNGLSREWGEAKNVTDEEREAIRALSRQAEQLTEALHECYRNVERIAESRRKENQSALNDLRRGRRSVTIYRPEGLVSPGFIDRKA